MKSAAYFQQRAEAVKRRGMQQADAAAAQLAKDYRAAGEAIQAQIRKIYERYGEDYRLTYAGAREEIAKSAYGEWRMELSGYVERISATGDQELLRELNALSARSRISRYEQLSAAINVELSALAAQEESRMTGLLGALYEESYYQTAYDLQKGMGAFRRLSLLPSVEIAEAASYPWSGEDFSGRIWENRDALCAALRRTLTQGLIQGQDVRQMTAALSERLQAGAKECERLIVTESARVIEDAERKSYIRCGVTKYEILGVLDRRACPVCGKQDGKIYAVKDAQTGKNYPPFHPRCRCTTAAVFDEAEAEASLRAARNGKGDYVPVPADMTYEQWLKGLKGEFHDPMAGEWEISHLEIEHGILYNKKGNIIFRKDGEKDRVGVTWREMRKMKDGVFSHNHPSGASFSWQDIDMLRQCKLAEVRAVTKRGVYSMTAPEKWPKIIGTEERLQKEYDAIRQSINEQVESIYGNRSASEQLRIASDWTAQEFANAFGLDYHFEEW